MNVPPKWTKLIHLFFYLGKQVWMSLIDRNSYFTWTVRMKVCCLSLKQDNEVSVRESTLSLCSRVNCKPSNFYYKTMR